MYAIVKIGGKQYRAEPGKNLVVEKLTSDVGSSLEFGEVLLISDGENSQIGQPFVDGAVVSAEVASQFRGKKIIVFKYKPKIKYRRKTGHRQYYTLLKINSVGGESSDSSSEAKPARKKPAARKKAATE
jgi:large subunit ribosomal protein L21